MIYQLFESHWDALVFILDRPVPLALLGLICVLLVIAKWKPTWLPARISIPLREHGAIYAILAFWLVSAYTLFHVIVPAASFFFERLLLVLWTPFVLLLSLFIADVIHGLRIRLASVVAVICVLGFLGGRDRLAFFEQTILSSKRSAVRYMAEALMEMDLAKGTKVYATPSEQLTITYYTGMPVQSVAPVRREFFETYPGPILFIYMQMDADFPEKYDLLEAAAWEGIEPTDANLLQLGFKIWEVVALRDIAERGIVIPKQDPVPDFLKGYVEKTYWQSVQNRELYLRRMQASPVMRGIPASRLNDLWLGFFYRFVDPASRIGKNLNIIPRLNNAEIVPVAGAGAILFLSPAPPS
jgi:hypothetical protein